MISIRRMRWTLHRKMLFIVVGASLLLTMIMGIIFYFESIRYMEDRYQSDMKSVLHSNADNFDNVMKHIYFTCTYATAREELGELLDISAQSYDIVQEEKLSTRLDYYTNSNSLIQSAYLYCTNAEKFIKVDVEGTQFRDITPKIEAWMEEINRKVLADPFSPVFNVDITSPIHRKFFTYTKKIYSENGNEIGQLFLNVSERDIYYMCIKNEESGNNIGYIVQDDEIVSAADMGIIGHRYEITDGKMTVTVNSSLTKYKFLLETDLSPFHATEKSIGISIFMAIVLLNILICIPVHFILRSTMMPVKKLEWIMSQVQEGNLSIRAKIFHQDEIGALSEHFNAMIGQIERLIEEVVMVKMQKKEAEIEALHYQITPHFMYNTLASIRYAAMLEKNGKLAEILRAFIELLRMSASDRGAFITVEQEIQMVENYADIQKFRYADSFEVAYHIEEEAKKCYVPRLLVQPLVENAILHGLNHRGKNSRIDITVTREGNELCIRVSDNGVGMTQEELIRLESGKQKSKFSGIGIHNIRERLRLYYDKKGILEYRSSINEGTEAIIRLPATEDPRKYQI